MKHYLFPPESCGQWSFPWGLICGTGDPNSGWNMGEVFGVGGNMPVPLGLSFIWSLTG